MVGCCLLAQLGQKQDFPVDSWDLRPQPSALLFGEPADRRQLLFRECSRRQWRAGGESKSDRTPPVVVKVELQKRPLDLCKLLLEINCSRFLKLFAFSITLKVMAVNTFSWGLQGKLLLSFSPSSAWNKFHPLESTCVKLELQLVQLPQPWVSWSYGHCRGTAPLFSGPVGFRWPISFVTCSFPEKLSVFSTHP